MSAILHLCRVIYGCTVVTDLLVYQALPEKPLTKVDGFDRLARGEPFAAFFGRCELSVSTGSFKGQTMPNLFSVLVIEQLR